MGSALAICLVILAGLGYALFKAHQDLGRTQALSQAAQTRLTALEEERQAALESAGVQRRRAVDAEAQAHALRERMELVAQCLGADMIPQDPAGANAWLTQVARELTWSPA